MGFSYSEYNLYGKVPCVFIPWVAFLSQDSVEWKSCTVDTRLGRCYRQIPPLIKRALAMCQAPCEPFTCITWFILHNQPRAGPLASIPALQMRKLRQRKLLSLPADPEPEEAGWGFSLRGVSARRPTPPAHPVSSFIMVKVFPPPYGQILCLSPLCIPQRSQITLKKKSCTSASEYLLHGKLHMDRNFTSLCSNWSLPLSWYEDA